VKRLKKKDAEDLKIKTIVESMKMGLMKVVTIPWVVKQRLLMSVNQKYLMGR
jgi:hypothetical protein